MDTRRGVSIDCCGPPSLNSDVVAHVHGGTVSRGQVSLLRDWCWRPKETQTPHGSIDTILGHAALGNLFSAFSFFVYYLFHLRSCLEFG